MPRISKFVVMPKLPEKLEALRTISNNLWWCWDPEAIELFFRIDRDLWVSTNQNPVRMLGEISQVRFEELASDDSFLAHLERVSDRLNTYLTRNPWRERNPQAPDGFNVAYLSMEFGLQESMPIYSGGMGLLAGDHLKSASDLGLPLTGVGLLYREGYFQQYLNADGWQQELYPDNDFFNMALEKVRDEKGGEVVIEIPYPQRPVKARLWRCMVGRVPLYMLDADVEANHPDDRAITARLYGGDRDMRIRQEILLGMGGVKALSALGIVPTVYHMNEGHSAFLVLQRTHDLMVQQDLGFNEAFEAVKAGSVFTTHTPVPAGNDMFAPSLVDQYFKRFASEAGISIQRLLGLGRQDPNDEREPFCMTVLALRGSACTNGVSKLHGEVARGMWARTWENIPVDEIPITSITNGVHPRFWISRDLAGLYDRYVGPGWIENPGDTTLWERLDDVPDGELWRTHERRRERLVNFARRRLAAQMRNRGVPNSEIEAAAEVLDPEALTIGFARRFATYKRAVLFLQDEERLIRLLCNEERPVQLIFAGKAHPDDHQGKELIRRIVHFARRPEVRGHIIFLENYDINVARYMVQGVDCWLNTPRRPMEASGTSGMKAAANGALNISIPDGWWCEAELLGENGWSIGRGETYASEDEQDLVEGEALFEILEAEVVPMFYDRRRDGLPREWISRMKCAIRTICPTFNSDRQVQEYSDRFYLPCAIRHEELCGDEFGRVVALAAWKDKVRRCWNKVEFKDVQSGLGEELSYGATLPVSAELQLTELSNADVTVEIYYGDMDKHSNITGGKTVTMDCVQELDGGLYRFEGAIPCEKTGQQGFSLRVIPYHADLAQKHEMALIKWH